MTVPDKFKGSLAVTSAIAGILAAVVGGWLTGHWLWAPACGFLVLIGIVAISEALKARHEAKPEDGGEPPESMKVSGNTSFGLMNVAGGNIQNGTFTTINQNLKTVNRGIGGIAGIVALAALGGAVGGTLYFSQQTNSAVMESPQSLAADGGHSTPDAAVKGYIGDALLDDGAGACNYVLPDEQQTCINDYMQNGNGAATTTQGTSLETGGPIIQGTLALVPVAGKLCQSGSCHTSTASGLPSGTSFQTAFGQAMDYGGNGNMFPCEEINNTWYVNIPAPGSQGYPISSRQGTG